MIATVRDDKWYIWLSMWSFLLIALYFVCATIVTAIHYKRERKERAHGHHARDEKTNDEENFAGTADFNRNSNDRCKQSYELETKDLSDGGDAVFIAHASEASRAIPMAWFHEALWAIYNMSAVASILVTLSFWLLRFDSSNKVSAASVIFHGLTAIVMVVDTMLSSIPVRLFHAIYPMLYCIAYIIFTLIYWAAGGTNSFGLPYIYPQTDYMRRPVLSAVSQLCLFFIGIPLCQSLMFGFFRLRVWVKNKCRK